MKLREVELTKKAEAKLREALGRVPFIEVGPARHEQSQSQVNGIKPDLLVQITTPDGPLTLVIEVKSFITPKTAREVSRQLAELAVMIPAGYAVVAAPYISERSAQVCRDEGIGYMDLAGNYGFYLNRVFLESQGQPNLFRKGQELKSIFSPKSSRAIRVLLENPGRAWKIQELAQEAKLSAGMVSIIKSKLEEQELIKKETTGFILTEPEKLLIEWSQKYTAKKNRRSDYYIPQDVQTIEKMLAGSLKSLDQRYAFSLFSGASKVAPFARYNRVFVYVEGDQAPLVEQLGLQPVDSGPNVTLLEPFDEGVFYGGKEVGGQAIVGAVQLYLDLVSYKGRGEDAARFLLENALRKKWQEGT